jgi:DmsE family decaheme c-type cytochrome
MKVMFGPQTQTRSVCDKARSLGARLAALFGLLFLLTTTIGRAQEKAAAPAPPAPANKPADYVGSQTCQMCHEDIFNAFQKNPHQIVETDKKRGWDTKACESCHGPGSKHAESATATDIRQPAKLTAAQADRICLTCHQNQITHVGRINSSHAANQVSCTACHSIHKNGPHGLVARKPAEINQQCAACHANIWASFQKPYKHPLPQGAMSCVDCHNPHGSVLASSIRTTRANEPACVNCHGDKVGPFPFEHAPVRLEGCGACHQPHGSANPRMLTRPQVRYVCMECHSNLPVPAPAPKSNLGTVGPALHDLRSPRFQNCTLCHQKVHGSYVDRALFK